MTPITFTDWLSSYNSDEPCIPNILPTFRPGYLILLDALGFRNKCESLGYDAILRKMSRIRSQVLSARRSLNYEMDMVEESERSELKKMKPKVFLRYFSDNFLCFVYPSGPYKPSFYSPQSVLSCELKNTNFLSADDLKDSLLLCKDYAGKLSARLFIAALSESEDFPNGIQWCFRGVISSGLLGIRNGSFVGSPIEDAATWFEKIDAGLIATTSKFSEMNSGYSPEGKIVKYFLDNWSERPCYSDVDIPIKGSNNSHVSFRKKPEMVVNPFCVLSVSQLEKLELSIEKAFYPNVNERVDQLRNNTIEIVKNLASSADPNWRSRIRF